MYLFANLVHFPSLAGNFVKKSHQFIESARVALAAGGPTTGILYFFHDIVTRIQGNGPMGPRPSQCQCSLLHSAALLCMIARGPLSLRIRTQASHAFRILGRIVSDVSFWALSALPYGSVFLLHVSYKVRSP